MSDINTEKMAREGQADRFFSLLRAEYPNDHARIAAGFSAARPVTMRVNTLKTTADAARASLEREGIATRAAPWYCDALIAEDADERALRQTEAYLRGEIYLQSLSSMLPPLVIAPRAGESILDMTAAPGGKTTQMLALSGGGARITACEKDRFRFEKLRFNLERQGAGRVAAMCADAATLDPYFRFDKILLDAPCSGSGTYRGTVTFSEALLSGCMRTQRRLLKKAYSLLKPGGTLVYSTCSVLKEENERAIGEVADLGGALVPVDTPFVAYLPQLPSAAGTVTVCPDGRFEGFFLAKIVKKS